MSLLSQFSNIRSLKKSLFCSAAVAALAVSQSSTAEASHCAYARYTVPSAPQTIAYRTVTVWETRTKRVVSHRICYDHCGRPYIKQVVSNQSVKVPVKKQVPVRY